MALNVAKFVNSWRNTKKSRFAKLAIFFKFAKQTETLLNARIRGEIQKHLSLQNFQIFEIRNSM